MTAGAKTDRRAARAERLRAALRDNLKRRKAQARGRDDESSKTAASERRPGEAEAFRDDD